VKAVYSRANIGNVTVACNIGKYGGKSGQGGAADTGVVLGYLDGGEEDEECQRGGLLLEKELG
jgi:hypothetical protein